MIKNLDTYWVRAAHFGVEFTSKYDVWKFFAFEYFDVDLSKLAISSLDPRVRGFQIFFSYLGLGQPLGFLFGPVWVGSRFDTILYEMTHSEEKGKYVGNGRRKKHGKKENLRTPQ